MGSYLVPTLHVASKQLSSNTYIDRNNNMRNMLKFIIFAAIVVAVLGSPYKQPAANNGDIVDGEVPSQRHSWMQDHPNLPSWLRNINQRKPAAKSDILNIFG